MKTRVFNLIILDESGSMRAIRQQAITGVNETIQTIRNAQNAHPDQEHYVTLVSFDSTAIKTIYNKVLVNNVEELTDKQYVPNACTPLYDAMGVSLNNLTKSVSQEDIVLVTIITDGYENASVEYTRQSIKHLVESLQKHNWVFTYIGANQDVLAVAQSLSINNSLCFDTTAEGTAEMFAKESQSRIQFCNQVSACQSPRERANLARSYDYFKLDDDDE